MGMKEILKAVLKESVYPFIETQKSSVMAYMAEQQKIKRRKKMRNSNKAKKISLALLASVASFFSAICVFMSFMTGSMFLFSIPTVPIAASLWFLLSKKSKKYRSDELEMVFWDLLYDCGGKISDLELMKASGEEIEYIHHFLNRKLIEIPQSELEFDENGYVRYDFPFITNGTSGRKYF